MTNSNCIFFECTLKFKNLTYDYYMILQIDCQYGKFGTQLYIQLIKILYKDLYFIVINLITVISIKIHFS